MKRYFSIYQLILALIAGASYFVMPIQSYADTNYAGLPEVIVGQTEVTSPAGQKYYGGLGGNEAVLNYQPDFLHGFKKTDILNCSDKIALSELLCHTLTVENSVGSSLPTSIRNMTSRTYRDGSSQIEIAVLLYPDNLIIGDVYGFNNSNFTYSYFGKNLRLTPDNSASNSFWNLPGYIFNPQAQAFWNTGAGDKNATMNTTIERLKSNSVSLRNNIFDAYFSWQKKPFDGVCGNPTSNCREKNQYPEGRIWYTPGYARTDAAHPGMEISGVALNYQNKATTIIQQGNVKISTAIKNQDESSALGIIVRDGNVVINNPTNKKMTIVADIFVPNGTINILNSNIEMIGSFVAKDFQFNPDISNISFIYHQRNDSAWPPGFRDLQLPSLLAK